MVSASIPDPRALRWAFWSATVALSGLIVVNSLPYFSFGTNFAFLVEKGSLVRDTLWRASFYAHVSGGVVCLVSGPFLVSGRLLRHLPSAHRILGRAYVMAVLGCAGPSGLYMALHARGGVAGQAGFLVLGAAWMFTTLRGVELVARRRITQHRQWMLRSYALTLSAVFFRMLHVGLYVAGASDETNYVVSLWASLCVSIGVGEVLARAPWKPQAALDPVGVDS